VLIGGDGHSRSHIRNQANPQHMMDIAGDKLTGKTSDDQVVFAEVFARASRRCAKERSRSWVKRLNTDVLSENTRSIRFSGILERRLASATISRSEISR
jgi:hypothetical protein